MPDQRSVFQGSFSGPNEEALHRGRRPVIFDILAPDRETSLFDALEEDLRLVLHVNPSTMSFTYNKQTERVTTRGGFVEFHWGDALESISFEAATGGFMRLYSGLSNIAGTGGGTQGRRETIAYERYTQLLALYHHNGAIYDKNGNIVVQGYVKMIYDGGTHIGWFDNQFRVTESATTPFMFNLSAQFIIDKEEMAFKTAGLYDFDGQSASIPGGIGQDSAGTSSTAILDPLVNPFEDEEP